jgi:serine/threonine protein kinase
MIGEIIKSESTIYKIIDKVSVERQNADVYLCENDGGEKFIGKYFCHSVPRSNIGLGEYNHYGRGRDGSRLVFSEIKAKSQMYNFLVRHVERVKHAGNWLIIIEYISGTALQDFIYNNWGKHPAACLMAIEALAKELATWHKNGFAHGDPHLENAMVSIDSDGSYSVKLIDYGQIHHKDFYYCGKYDCFNPQSYDRFAEDLENCGKLGHGFRNGIIALQEELETTEALLQAFDRCYLATLKAS